jgi:DNA polymerase-3 subunit beta
LEPQWIEIKDDHVEYHIVGMNPDDFPDRPHIEDIDFFTIPSAVFKSMIEKTTFIGFPRDEKRAHIIGVYFERIEKNQNCMIRMVSTDARRLSKVEYIFNEDTNVPSFDNVLIPKAGLNEVNKFLNTPCELQIGIKNNFFIVKKENETIIISLLEGEFPDYYNLVKTEEIYSLRLNRYLFLMMLKRMSILSSEANKSVVFNLESGKLVMTTTNPDIGESREEMNIDYAREPIEVAFNPKYFIETLNSIEEEEIFLYIRDAQSPCLIEGTADKHFLSVIMPMKI